LTEEEVAPVVWATAFGTMRAITRPAGTNRTNMDASRGDEAAEGIQRIAFAADRQ
jgi:hypothetical protein